MRVNIAARFMRVGSHLINLEAIQQVHLKTNDSAVMVLHGPKKSLVEVQVAAPDGRELWEFVNGNLVVVEFGKPVHNPVTPANEGDSPKPKKAARRKS